MIGDMAIELREDVVAEIRTRVINANALTYLNVSSPVSRLIANTVPPWQCKAHWAEPEISLHDDAVEVSATVTGGIRYAVKGINLSTDGKVRFVGRPRVTTTDQLQPVAVLTEPSALDLDLAQLWPQYKGGPDVLTWPDGLVVDTVLRPVLCTQVMAPLARLPLTCLPQSPPLALGGAGPSESVAFDSATVTVNRRARSVTLALGGPGPSGGSLAIDDAASMSVALSDRGLNRLLDWMCAWGQAHGEANRDGAGPSWQWTSAATTFAGSTTNLTGNLVRGDRRVPVDCSFQAQFGRDGLSVRVTGATGPDVRLIEAAWAHLLGRVLLAGPGPRQVFVIPSTDLSLDAVAVDLSVRDGYLVARYAVQLGATDLELSIEDAEPEPIIQQLIVPRQDTAGAPVTVSLTAQLAHSPEPPYDFAWQVDDEPHLRSTHGPTLSLTRTPGPTVAGAAPARLASVRLTVVDVLGRAGRSNLDATYYPAEQHQRSQTRRPARAMAATIAAAIAAAIVAIIGFVILHGRTPEPGPDLGERVLTSTTEAPPATTPAPLTVVLPTGEAPTTSSQGVRPGLTSPSRQAPPTTTSQAPPPTSQSQIPPPPVHITLATSAASCAPADACTPVPDCATCSTVYKGKCGAGVTIAYDTDIKVDQGPTKVEFGWILNGTRLPTDTVTFTGTGTQHETVGQSAVLNVSTGLMTAQLQTFSPQPVTSNTVTAQITCI
jgi:hypothetical protein